MAERYDTWLQKRNVKCLTLVINPSKMCYKESEGEKIQMFELKNTGRYFELTQRMKEIVHMDLRMVDVSDLLLFILIWMPDLWHNP